MTDEKLLFIATRARNSYEYLSKVSDTELEELGEELIRRFPMDNMEGIEKESLEGKLFILKVRVMRELENRDSKSEKEKIFQVPDEELMQLAIRIQGNEDTITKIPDNELKRVSVELLRRYPPKTGIIGIIGGSLDDHLMKLERAVIAEIKRRDKENITVPEISDNPAAPFSSPLGLTSKHGAKLNLMRVFDALWELQYFKIGDRIATRAEVMDAIGLLINEDFSNFESGLSQSYNDTKLETNIAIFEEMKRKITQKCLHK